MEIPLIPIDHGHLDKNSLVISSIAKDIAISFDEDQNMIWLNVSNLSGTFTCDDFEYDFLFDLIPDYGNIKASMNSINLALGV